MGGLTDGPGNLCRNPSKKAKGAKTIWCYTTDSKKRWEYCEPKSTKSLAEVEIDLTAAMDDTSAQCYLNRYKDLQKAFGPRNVGRVKAHWKSSGQREKRNGSCDAADTMFSAQAQCYLNRYKDLQKAFGAKSVDKAKLHWVQYGRNEKRNNKCDAVDSMSNDQAQCYLDRYKDLQKAFGAKSIGKAKLHWVQYGRSEKRNNQCDKFKAGEEKCSGKKCKDYRGA